jgi:hypothetical protein
MQFQATSYTFMMQRVVLCLLLLVAYQYWRRTQRTPIIPRATDCSFWNPPLLQFTIGYPADCNAVSYQSKCFLGCCYTLRILPGFRADDTQDMVSIKGPVESAKLDLNALHCTTPPAVKAD